MSGSIKGFSSPTVPEKHPFVGMKGMMMWEEKKKTLQKGARDERPNNTFNVHQHQQNGWDSPEQQL